MWGKPLKRRLKARHARPEFTLCLPGSPKVNAGGACGAWLPGRAVPTSDQHQVRQARDVIRAELAKNLAGTTLGQARAMDGAGRLARSLRSLGPQADLKAAAIGAVVLLRERLGLRARVPARPVIDRKPPNRLILLLERYLPNRAGVALTVLMLLGSTGLGIVKGGHVNDFMVALSDTRNALANSAGFRITTVAINGRRQLSQDEVLAIGGVSGRSSLLFLDAETVRDRLKANPWIADATILKLYPGRLQIDIVERTAFALWQQDGRLSVIAEDGAVLEPYVSRRFVT